MARITDLVDENGELLYPISTIGAIYKDNQTAEQWVEGLTNTLNTKIDTHVLEEITSENGVHGIRYYNDVLSYKNMFGEWVEITTSGGNTPTPPTPTETPLGEPTNVSLTNADESVVIMWTDPEDVDTSVWNGTVVVRKEGSVPTDKSDGTIVVDSRTRNQYATSGYTDTGLTNGTEYFYGIFPYTTNETYTNTYTTSITPSAIYPSAPTNVSVEAGDAQITISFTTPSDATGTRIVWGTSAPADENDGNTINNVSGSFTITGLTNWTTYYVRVYSYNAKGRFSGSDVLSAIPESAGILVPWTVGTDTQIITMVNAYYNGEISLDDVKSVWSVGDSRTMQLSAMAATYVGESHDAQTVELTIIDFDHDDLVSSVNGKTKALVSIQLKNMLGNMGYMNSTNTNTGGWENCSRRSWCNNIFYGAISSTIKGRIKQVLKQNYREDNNTTITTTSDYCFLLSETEVFGTTTSIVYNGIRYPTNSIGSDEGTQYEYYKTSSNRIKQASSGSGWYWWERSLVAYANNPGYCDVLGTGIPGAFSPNGMCGISPAFCL